MTSRAVRRRRTGLTVMTAVLLVLAAAAAAPAADRVYWANGNNTISFAFLDGSGGTQLNLSGATASGPRGVAVDPVAGRIYWANQGNDTISYANLDNSGGGGELNLAGATIARPHGVAIDPATRRIYWANDTGNPVSWASLDGSGGGQLATPGTNPGGPYGIAIDTVAKKVYWANRDTDTISYAALDGSGGGELNLAGSSPEKPHGVTIDPTTGKVYWANLGNTISYAKLDGSGGGGEINLSGGGPGGPVGMAIDPAAGQLFFANLGNDAISFVALDGSGAGGQLPHAGANSIDPRFMALVETPRADAVPSITGGSAFGSVLSCSEPSWAPDMPEAFLYRAPLTVTHGWLRDGAEIAGAPSTAYTAFAPGAYACRTTASGPAGATRLTSAPHVVAAPAAAGAAPAPVAAKLPPAAASFAGSRSPITVGRRGGFRIGFLAAEAGTAVLDSAGKVRVRRGSARRERLALARTSFGDPPGGKVSLALRLSKRNLRILRLNRRLSTRITVTLRSADGLTTTSSRRLTLRAPR